ncbi:hypothetical protein Gogos_009110 [Gossypium gossypioides]|uniref:Uncharacterized protein n=1 Tax=Gossypium gossypioides TaxID=34282 RepID=A0A7J9CDT8_GOSGO|nr:hypothetical protein [Gossypium gossypioides]
MGRKTALEVGEAIGEVMAIDWRDRDGGHKTQKCMAEGGQKELNKAELQYGNCLRVQMGSTTQGKGNWRNGVDFLEGGEGSNKKTKVGDEESRLSSHAEKRQAWGIRDGGRRNRGKREKKQEVKVGTTLKTT